MQSMPTNIINDNGIDCEHLTKWIDSISINKKGVESLDINGLCRIKYIPKEVWTNQPVLLIHEDTINRLKN